MNLDLSNFAPAVLTTNRPFAISERRGRDNQLPLGIYLLQYWGRRAGFYLQAGFYLRAGFYLLGEEGRILSTGGGGQDSIYWGRRAGFYLLA